MKGTWKTVGMAASLLMVSISAHAASIGIDFGAGSNTSSDPDPSAMSVDEVAGMVPQANWNSFSGNSQASPQALNLDDGTSSGATVTWSCSAIWDTSVNSKMNGVAGDARMMNGYLDTSDSSVTTVSVSGIPASFLTTGYRVIAYYDGENGGNQRVGAYTLNGVTLYGRDAANSVFSGLYEKAQTTTAPTGGMDGNAAGALEIPAGNYVEFTNLTSASFTLTAAASVSSDSINRAPLGGIQIIQNSSGGTGTTEYLTSPDGQVAVTLSDEGRLSYEVAMDGNTVVARSALGLAFGNGTLLGPGTTIMDVTYTNIDDSWENLFGPRREVSGGCTEGHFVLSSFDGKTFGLYVRAYNNGVAFRYEIPEASGMGTFTVVNELSQFHFASDWDCRIGSPHITDESVYNPQVLSDLPSGYNGVVPLLVEAGPSNAIVSVTESDLRDWSGMCLQGSGSTWAQANVSKRSDGNGQVVSTAPRNSPWRVLMLARKPADLMENDLVATLAPPSEIADTSWIEPGASAWDVWWTGVNPYDPTYTGTQARGTTQSHKDYIDLAAEMGWTYQVMDWDWYLNGDFDQVSPSVDIPELISYANSKGVKLIIWLHSADVKNRGVVSTLDLIKNYGFAGVKVDFFDSQSQETVQYVNTLVEEAAARQLLVDCHGVYHPTGLARTWPNFITQEGIRGNEYNKLDGSITSDHQASLALTRATLGPMDYTPGGFLNRHPADFSATWPAQVMNTRARELALPVVYPSPLTVFCDSPTNYYGQPGLDFYRSFPTVWDDSAVLSASFEGNVAVARRSGDSWRVGVIGKSVTGSLDLPFDFLGGGEWALLEYADSPLPGAAATDLLVGTRLVRADDVYTVPMNATGGFAGILQPLSSAYLSGWQSGDIGDVAIPGSFSNSVDTITLGGSGTGIEGSSDAFRFAWQGVFGDCDIVAQLVGMNPTNSAAKAGLMIREGINPNSSFAMNLMTTNGLNLMQSRTATGSVSTNYDGTAGSAATPHWLRLNRTGNTFTSYYGDSADGPWTAFGSVEIPMTAGVFVGLAVSSHDDGSLCDAVFSNVVVSAAPLTPVDLSATAAAGGGIQLNWTAVQSADTYEIWRSDSATGTFSLVASGISGSGYADTNASSGETSFYTVRAVNTHGSSSDSAIASATAHTLIEVWRLANFGTTEAVDSAADSADPDHDGGDNLLEYATGRDPLNADSLPFCATGTSSNALKFTITFDRIGDPSLFYGVDCTADLTNTWSRIWSSTGAENIPGPVTVEDTNSLATSTSGFMRLQVSRPAGP